MKPALAIKQLYEVTQLAKKQLYIKPATSYKPII